MECNKKFGFSAERTLQLIQSLYEKKLTTYPRVDTSFLPNELHGKAPGILSNLVPYATFVQPLLQQGKLPKRAKVFNDKKITDHHAIIPTGEWAAASGLSKDEKYVLDLVVRRFIAVFYPDCEFASTVVNAKVTAAGVADNPMLVPADVPVDDGKTDGKADSTSAGKAATPRPTTSRRRASRF